MTRALANGVPLEDDAKVDEEQGWMRLIQGIEPPHLRIMTRVSGEDAEHPGTLVAATREELKVASGSSRSSARLSPRSSATP